MIRNNTHRTSPFPSCCSPQHYPQPNYNPTHKKNSKISLKSPNDKTCKQRSHISPTHKHQYTLSYNCPTVIETLSPPKPKITFCWKGNLDSTTKKLAPRSSQLQASQLQLRETRCNKLHSKMLIESKFTGEQRVSRNSMNLYPQSPKLEESLIMVDYFHPTHQQLAAMHLDQ